MKTSVIILISLFFIISNLFANDSLSRRIDVVNYKMENLNDKIDQIKQGQLNYQIEKDLLKETYSNNYDKLNTGITIILGIVGVLGFLGIRDINAIKKEYSMELENLRKVKTEFEVKSQNFEIEKEKFQQSLREIVQQNEEQNSKIRVLEIKEKIDKMLKSDEIASALEYCNIGLELIPTDIQFLNQKGVILTRFGLFNESKDYFKKAFDLAPMNLSIAANYVESLYFSNKIQDAKKIIDDNKEYFKSREDGKLLLFLALIEQYYDNTDSEFKDYIKTFLDFENLENKTKYFVSWSLKDALYFVHYQPDSQRKVMLQNIFWFLDAQVNTRTVIDRLDILPI